jgi:hypothetical protein
MPRVYTWVDTQAGQETSPDDPDSERVCAFSIVGCSPPLPPQPASMPAISAAVRLPLLIVFIVSLSC